VPDIKGGGALAKPIRAAGGVVWRPAARAYDGVEVVVIRRDRYGDWTLPKGKLDPDEKHKAAALREVLEETGIACELGPKLCRTSYTTPLGPKRVKWWAMTPAAGRDPAEDPTEGGPAGSIVGGGDRADAGRADRATAGTPADPEEVSEVLWLPFEEAWERLTYGTDRKVLSAFAQRVIARTK
jgi:8-oxo-dGTP pyrophosphatase MutT (NUDIX family)